MDDRSEPMAVRQTAVLVTILEGAAYVKNVVIPDV